MAIEVSRIEKEFIIKHMRDAEVPVELVHGSHRAMARLVGVDKELTVRVHEGDIGEARDDYWVDMFLFFKGTRVACRTVVTGRKQDLYVVKYPDHLYRDLTRNYERIRPEGTIGVSILLGSTTLKLDYPEHMNQNEAQPPEPNVKFDAAKIADLLRGFRDKTKSFANENKIVMFRERTPESVVEHLVTWSGKMLMLPLADAQTPFKRREEDQRDILSEEDISSIFKSSGQDALLLNQELNGHIEAMFTKKIWHELYVPILYGQYVIGYIYLLRSEGQVSQFSPSVIDFVRQFTRILAYSLAANNYFKATRVRDSFEKSELVDVSGSGILFSIPLSGPSIELLSDIDVKLQLPEHTISLHARIMRRFQQNGRVFLGAKYLEVSDDDLDFLMNTLYGKSPGFGFSDEPVIAD